MLLKKCIVAVSLTVVVTALGMTLLYFLIFDSSGPPANFEQQSITSGLLGEERSYLVNLPESYQRNPDQRYPVLYVLGGSSLAFVAAADIDLMARLEVIPEVIVVNVPNAGNAERQRDYTPPFMRRDLDEEDSKNGAADLFLDFLADELLPEVGRKYRTSAVRMIAGHSRGGLFVMYALLEKPGLFQANFAYSPALWREDDLFIDHLNEGLGSGRSLDTFVFMSLGDMENEKMTRAFGKAVSCLQGNVTEGLRWRAEYTMGAGHGNNAQVSLPVGLLGFFVE
jgi:predicted alpha/beta superfamily hydrolase